MAESSRPWNYSLATGDYGPYSYQNWAEVWRMVFGASQHQNSCVVPDSGVAGTLPLEVVENSPASADVRVRAGAALVNGVFYYLDTIDSFAISSNSSGNPRIDTVILKWDSTAQTVRIAVKEGTPAGSPVAPTLTNSATVKEVPLADIAVANGFSTITQSNITPRAKPIAFNNVNLIVVQNNSGADISHGRMVEFDSTNDRSIQLSDSLVDVRGVTYGDILDTEWGLVATRGITTVYTEDAVTRGEAIMPGTAAGEMRGDTHSNQLRIADALETTSGAGYVMAYVCPVSSVQLAYHSHEDTGYSTTSVTYVELDSVDTSVNLYISTGKVRVTFSFEHGYSGANAGFYTHIDLRVDGVSHSGGTYMMRAELANGRLRFNFDVIIDGLSIGTHDFDIYWLNQSGASRTVYADTVQYTVQEIH